MKCFWPGLALGILAALPSLSADPDPSSAPQAFTFHQENVLGTSFEFQAHAPDAATAARAESIALAEIDRLSAIFSTYSKESEFSRWQSTRNIPVSISPELFQVMSASDHWQSSTLGAFNPGAEAFTRLWKDSSRVATIPSPSALQDTAKTVARPAWKLDGRSQTATHQSDTPLTFNAIAKGFIIERASALAAATPGVSGVLLEIGGDLRVRGDFPHRIAIADPKHDAENARPLTEVVVRSAALATSGGYRRGTQSIGRHFSHIIDPRTGVPAEEIASSTVIAPDAMDADALSTSFSVLKPEESLRLAESIPDVACLLVLADGQILRNSRWPQPEYRVAALADVAPAKSASATSAEDSLEVSLSFEIQRVEGGRYQRPYVAAWVEDKDNFPLRTLLLWVLQSEKGQRWVPDLRRWNRGDQVRRLAEDKDLLTTLSGATRNPGKYSVVWDGKDDHGVAVKPGTYTLYLEIAREHGTYQLMKHEFEWGGKPFSVELKGNEEVKGATVEQRRHNARK